MTVIPIAMRKSEFRAAHRMRGDQGQQGFRRQARHRRHLYRRAQRRGIRAAGRASCCSAPMSLNNVRLMLLSGIGKPYDPVTQTGVVGKNYCYQTGAGATLFFEGKYFNPFMGAGGSGATIGRLQHQMGVRPRAARFRRRLQSSRRLQHRRGRSAIARCRAARRNGAAHGSRRRAKCYQTRDDDRRQRQRDGQPLQLSRSRSDLSQRVRPAADAHDVRLQGQRAQDGRTTPPTADQRDRQGDEADQAQPGDCAHRAVDRRALPEHPQHRRRDHGQQSARQRAQQISAELGLPQPVRDRRQRVSAQFVATIRPDRSARWPTGPRTRSRTDM